MVKYDNFGFLEVEIEYEWYNTTPLPYMLQVLKANEHPNAVRNQIQGNYYVKTMKRINQIFKGHIWTQKKIYSMDIPCIIIEWHDL